ncbi:MAG TPA: hypothetical protein VNS32_19385, partial [Flavisolibacter sp.]|nr:hypothetical protein [Flavisolibacter sp.]
MKENALLAMLASLCGDITLANNPDHEKVFQLQKAIADALASGDLFNAADPFQFDQLRNYTSRNLDNADFQHLNTLLDQAVQEHYETKEAVRVFKRSVPFISSQVKGSMPEWARGAGIINSMGPFNSIDGRRFWFDFYRVIPLVQLWMQGAPQPFMLLPVEVRVPFPIIGPHRFPIPAGSVWINAELFTGSAPMNVYCGLTVKGGELDFNGPINIGAGNKVIVPPGITAAVKLNLDQKTVPDVSPDDNGIDAKEAVINLPDTLSFTINNAGRSFTGISNANWTLYGQSIDFTYDNSKEPTWSKELSKVLIPFTASVNDLEIIQCKSPLVSLTGKATIAQSWWSLSAASININAPLQADGTGAISLGVVNGIETSWKGLKDIPLKESSSTLLKNALVTLMPGRINIATLFASNPIGKQRFNLWQETVNGFQKPVQFIDLLFGNQFFFFYDSLQKGTESIAAQVNCMNSVDKPVQVDGTPFAVESMQTVFVLSSANSIQSVLLFDDNIITDNWNKLHPPAPGIFIPPVSFESSALALNNALLTVSP